MKTMLGELYLSELKPLPKMASLCGDSTCSLNQSHWGNS